MANLNDWWASLTVTQKERIASKAYSKAHPDEPTKEIRYPQTTVWWNSIPAEQQQTIHDHCTDKHGYLLPVWQEGQSQSY